MLEFREVEPYSFDVVGENGSVLASLDYFESYGRWVFVDRINWTSDDLRRIADMLDKLGYGPLEDKTP